MHSGTYNIVTMSHTCERVAHWAHHAFEMRFEEQYQTRSCSAQRREHGWGSASLRAIACK